MQHAAPAILHAIEMSAFAANIRQAVWVYPIANVVHVLGVLAFFAAVAFMDVRLMGAFAQTPAAAVVRVARGFAIGVFVVVMISGGILFAAEASHIALNWMFQLKMALIGLGLLNVLAFEFVFGRRLSKIPAGAPLPAAVRLSALVSLTAWLAVAACGRSIAYV